MSEIICFHLDENVSNEAIAFSHPTSVAPHYSRHQKGTDLAIL